MYCHGTWTQWSLGRVRDLNKHGVKGHLGVNDLWFKFLEKRVSVSTYFDVLSNLILQWLQKYVIAKAGETRGSRTVLFVFFFFTVLDIKICLQFLEFSSFKDKIQVCEFLNL